MINIIITAYGEVFSTEKAINSFLQQNIKEKFKIIVADPFPQTEELILNKFKKNVEYFQDPDLGKSNALNLLFKKLYSKNKNDILILTDGDVYVNDNAVQEIINKFKDPKVGCVSGRPVSLNSRNNLFGYWSHFLVDVGAHKISRKKRLNKDFIECSGYLFAFRNGIIKEIPVDVAEDSIVPYLFWKKGYRIEYADKALVYVKWPDNMKDWLKQKKRAADAHSKLKKYAPDFPKVKSFFNEVLYGSINFKDIWNYPRNLKEFFYTLALYPVRLYMWLALYKDLHTKKRAYKDGWREDLAVDSTRLDKF